MCITCGFLFANILPFLASGTSDLFVVWAKDIKRKKKLGIDLNRVQNFCTLISIISNCKMMRGLS